MLSNMDEPEENILTLADVTKAVQNTLQSHEVGEVQYEVKPASETPLGFMGEHVRIKVKATNIDNKQLSFNYFAKKIPSKVAAHREYAEKTKSFYKEIELYKTVFNDISKSCGHSLKWRPNCYFTRDWDLLIVEDLSTDGHYILPERTLIGLSHMKSTIKTLAHMHAGSIIFEEKFNKNLAVTQSLVSAANRKSRMHIDDLYPNLVFESECSDDPNHPGFAFWECGIKSQLAVMDFLPSYNQEEKRLIKKRFPGAMRQIYAMVKPSKEFRNVILHGDLWGNNILFKNDENGEVRNAIFVDFQLARYGPPAHDIFMLLHINQNQEFRNEHENDLLELYYHCLREQLSSENINIEEVLPKNEFDKSCEYFRKYAILNQIIYTQLNMASAEICAKFLSTPDLYNKINYEDRTDMLLESFQSDEFCRHRMIEAMDNVILEFKLNK